MFLTLYPCPLGMPREEGGSEGRNRHLAGKGKRNTIFFLVLNDGEKLTLPWSSQDLNPKVAQSATPDIC